jgi:hypothetical protein
MDPVERTKSPSCQRRLASQGVKNAVVFTPRGPSLRWGDAPWITRRGREAPCSS